MRHPTAVKSACHIYKNSPPIIPLVEFAANVLKYGRLAW